MVITSTNRSAARRIDRRRRRQSSRAVNVNSVKFKNPTVSNNRNNKFHTKKRQSSEKEEQDTRKNSSRDHDNEVVDKVTCEILSKLPVRSLMRFKCVCKPWRFLVEQDPYFIDLHFTCSKTRPKFFSFIDQSFRGKPVMVRGDYLSSDKGKGKAIVDIHTVCYVILPCDLRPRPTFFGPLNGLVGFYDCESYFGFHLSNVCTRQTTPWMKFTFLTKYKLENISDETTPESEIARPHVNCQLGFDPATRKHKVICIYVISYYDRHRTQDIFCEVLTVGDNEWRRIVDDVPSNLIDFFTYMGRSIYLNGSIYYHTFSLMKSDLSDNDKIVVFDVGSEKFRAITIPNSILYHPRDEDIDDPVGLVNLLEMDGHLALLCRINSYTVKIWLYEDDSKSNVCWREVAVELPFVWNSDSRLTFHSAAETNQIIMKYFDKEPVHDNEICMPSYHSYNWRKKTFTQVEINGFPFRMGDLFNFCHSDTIYMESLFYVK